MKTTFKSSLVLATILLAFSSCKKDDKKDSDQTGNPIVAESFNAKVDGVTFNETIITGMEFEAASKIIVGGSANSSYPAISFHMPNDITAGTYTFNGTTLQGLYQLGPQLNDSYGAAAGTGTLTITSHNTATNQVVGTFSFVATPVPGSSGSGSYNITEGSFAVDYD